MSDGEYTPLIDRQREARSRVHQELTKPARERLATITDDWGRSRFKNTDDHEWNKHESLNEVMKLLGREPVQKHYDSDGEYSPVKLHFAFVYNGKTSHVLTYIEILSNKEATMDDTRMRGGELKEKYGSVSNHPQLSDVYQMLVTEGMLWDMKWADEGGVVEFTKLESESMQDIDDEVQALAEKEPWDNALKGYNDAFQQYLDGDFDEHIPKKLYFSIEEVLKIICVDLEGWTENRELVHSKYLDMLNDHDLYHAHGATAAELGDFLDSLERMVAKVSDDRKQRHAYHDRAYATLLIHQVGAYLYFLISRYDDYNS